MRTMIENCRPPREGDNFLVIYYKIRLDLPYVKQTQNDNLTSDPPSALLRAGA
jgi:hypothetical protein